MSQPHFMAIGEALQARLRAALDSAGLTQVRVSSAADLKPDASIVSPALVVALDGIGVAEVAPAGRTARFSQRWVVVVVVRNVAAAAGSLHSGQAARADAGPLADLVLAALMGHLPQGACTALLPVTGPDLTYQDGLLLLPLAFEASLMRRAPPA